MPQQPVQNFDAMRQDAIRRSREMQRRAMPPPPPNPPQRPAPEPEFSPPPEPGLPPPPPPQPQGVNMPELLSALHLPDELNGLLSDWSGEKLALAGLLYLLYKEGADISLLLAIAYILL